MQFSLFFTFGVMPEIYVYIYIYTVYVVENVKDLSEATTYNYFWLSYSSMLMLSFEIVMMLPYLFNPVWAHFLASGLAVYFHLKHWVSWVPPFFSYCWMPVTKALYCPDIVIAMLVFRPWLCTSCLFICNSQQRNCGEQRLIF